MFFSMLSPLEWGGKPPNDYCDSYRLEYDMTWTQVGSPQSSALSLLFSGVAQGARKRGKSENDCASEWCIVSPPP